jgi:hypothetical protein
MGETLTTHDVFDVDLLPLRWEEERSNLHDKYVAGTLTLWTYGESFLVTEWLSADELGVPVAGGSYDEMKELIKQAAAAAHTAGFDRFWMRGRQGWEKMLKGVVNMKVHSVCYEVEHI